jgi:hypothetical protein
MALLVMLGRIRDSMIMGISVFLTRLNMGLISKCWWPLFGITPFRYKFPCINQSYKKWRFCRDMGKDDHYESYGAEIAEI